VIGHARRPRMTSTTKKGRRKRGIHRGPPADAVRQCCPVPDDVADLGGEGGGKRGGGDTPDRPLRAQLRIGCSVPSPAPPTTTAWLTSHEKREKGGRVAGQAAAALLGLGPAARRPGSCPEKKKRKKKGTDTHHKDQSAATAPGEAAANVVLSSLLSGRVGGGRGGTQHRPPFGGRPLP